MMMSKEEKLEFLALAIENINEEKEKIKAVRSSLGPPEKLTPTIEHAMRLMFIEGEKSVLEFMQRVENDELDNLKGDDDEK